MDEPELDGRELRNAFGCFATGITIVTTLDPAGAPVGVTVNSFSSVSLDPPLVLWSLNRTSSSFEVFNTAKHFVINILNTKGAHHSTHFAMRGGPNLDGLETVSTEMGPPAFAEALSVFECDTHARYDGGDHVILVGRVKHFSYVSDPGLSGPAPLLYYRGRYGVWSPTEG